MAKAFQDFGKSSGIKPDVHLNYEFIGRWKEANQLLRDFPHKVRQGINRGLREYSFEYKKQVVTAIETGGASLGWQPISGNYAKYKTKKVGHLNPWKFYGEILKNIKAHKSEGSWSVGIKIGIKSTRMQLLKSSTLELHQIAGILESGTDNIQSRPLFQPVYRNMGGPQGIRQYVARYIKLYLGKGYRTPGLRMPTDRTISSPRYK